MSTYTYPETSILVFCQASIADEFKTQPVFSVIAEQNASSHMAKIRRLLTLISDAALCRFELWCYPDRYHPFYVECVHDFLLPLYCQQGRDVGERMFNAVSTGLESSSRVLLVNCESQLLSLADYEYAITALKTGKDVVLALAEKGGYAMIGMTQAHPTLFDSINWDSPNMLALTRQRITEQRLNLIEITSVCEQAAVAGP
ncbi:TIGR04282 family arsenosugar biosynthesis glycosyltransferase [Methylophaga sp. OBS4]|uniref:TIGR04282 family arsenosugar biosynthesis glycosyltransferase n=1 Tax=Methylophaga sp. OBS4 TaxID=2991935 RepID=UPI0022533067|nr:DUF2064 domain-containing protein [Methylophaga sp. OBS4]MCX4187936.1 DUF2064 domain-containing protein [Methylophaga sp. OBS4]